MHILTVAFSLSSTVVAFVKRMAQLLFVSKGTLAEPDCA